MSRIVGAVPGCFGERPPGQKMISPADPIAMAAAAIERGLAAAYEAGQEDAVRLLHALAALLAAVPKRR